MKKMLVQMPLVSECEITNCGYNVKKKCHAKAITIGDDMNPGCDTYFNNDYHIRNKDNTAGVGACKVNTCLYNIDYECTAEKIIVGMKGKKTNCLTFQI